jgi:hypothetical protein
MINSAPTGQLTALSMLVLTTGINIEDLVLRVRRLRPDPRARVH